MTTDYPKKFKLQPWREKKYRKTTNEMEKWFPGGRNRPRDLSLTVADDDAANAAAADDDDKMKKPLLSVRSESENILNYICNSCTGKETVIKGRFTVWSYSANKVHLLWWKCASRSVNCEQNLNFPSFQRRNLHKVYLLRNVCHSSSPLINPGSELVNLICVVVCFLNY